MRLPDPREVDAAITAITNRRVTCEDPDLDLMPDDPLGVIRYVRSHQRVPRQALGRDAGDALRIVRCLRADLDRAEHALIGIAREARVSWPQIAEFLGLGTGEGVMLRHQRLESAIAGGPRSELSAREDRKADLRRRQLKAQKEGWVLSNGPRIRAAAQALLAAPLPQEAEDQAEELSAAVGALRPSYQDMWEALRMLLPVLRAEGELPPSASVAVGLTAVWEQKFPT